MQNVVDSQMFVSEFELDGYPVTEADILHTGEDAFNAALNTVNVGKFNLCSASVGICEHAFYEAITHAHNRILYGNPVTDFGHVRRVLRRRVRAPGRHEAVQRPGRRLLPHARTPRTGATCCSTRSPR